MSWLRPVYGLCVQATRTNRRHAAAARSGMVTFPYSNWLDSITARVKHSVVPSACRKSVFMIQNRPMSLLKTPAITLKSRKWGDADRIVTFYTLKHGKLRGVARGARRMKSRFGGTLEPFLY